MANDPMMDPQGVMNASFNEQKEVTKPLLNAFKETLETHVLTEKDIQEELSCAICQDKFKINDNIIRLPCNDHPHFFHKDNNVECNGIFPWFEEHNNCPICRSDFPAEPEPESEPAPEPETQEQVPLTPEQIAGLQMNNRINEIDLRVVHEIDTLLRRIIEERGEQENDEDVGNQVRHIIRPVNDVTVNGLIRQEEEELQATILRSMEER